MSESDSDSDSSFDVIAEAFEKGAGTETGAETGADATGTLAENIAEAAKEIGAALATTAATVASNVVSNGMPAPVAAPVATDAVSANVSLYEFNEREIIERGLQEFNLFLNSTSLESYVTDVDRVIQSIKLLPGKDISGSVVVSYCNPSISGLSDFVPHYNLFLFHEGAELSVDLIDLILLAESNSCK